MLKAILAASGGYAVGLYCTWESKALWEVIEAIELVTELQEAYSRK